MANDIELAMARHIIELALSITEQPRDDELTDHEYMEALAGCGYSVGFEEGLAIGLLAPKAADLWLSHIFTVIHGSDPDYRRQRVLEENADLVEAVGCHVERAS
jgi:hypothetical protein